MTIRDRQIIRNHKIHLFAAEYFRAIQCSLRLFLRPQHVVRQQLLPRFTARLGFRNGSMCGHVRPSACLNDICVNFFTCGHCGLPAFAGERSNLKGKL